MRTSAGSARSRAGTTSTEQRPLGLGIRGALLCSEDGERWMSARSSRKRGAVLENSSTRPSRCGPILVPARCTRSCSVAVTGGIRSSPNHRTGCAAAQRPKWRTVQKPGIPPQLLRVHVPGVPGPCGGKSVVVCTLAWVRASRIAPTPRSCASVHHRPSQAARAAVARLAVRSPREDHHDLRRRSVFAGYYRGVASRASCLRYRTRIPRVLTLRLRSSR